MTSPATIRRRHHARGFWIIGYTFAVTMAFAGAPVPLFVIYQEREGFGTVAATIVFAAYAFGVIASLFLAGHLSDRFGRLRMIAPAVLLNVLAGLIFLTSTDLGMLIVARVLSGLGVGMLTATATAHMTELHGTARPAMGRPAGHTSAMARPAGRAPATGRPAGRAETMSTAANIGGIGAGMLVAGMLADVTPRRCTRRTWFCCSRCSAACCWSPSFPRRSRVWTDPGITGRSASSYRRSPGPRTRAHWWRASWVSPCSGCSADCPGRSWRGSSTSPRTRWPVPSPSPRSAPR
ncbi:MFS transporter [Thermocatellispora tengchongensis]|uniref:MFS transporter n=1 Tax=Thermocatellispora tengchongensis TaxID=1073253 RepID=UPI00363A7141